MSNMTEW